MLHTVQQGECLSSIAHHHGFTDWRVIYDHPQNAGFKAKRPNPNLIYPGDELYIPEPEPQQVDGATEQRHRFKVRVEPNFLNVRLQDPARQPLARARYVLQFETLVRPLDPAFLARAAAVAGVSGTLTVPQGFVVEIVDIAGLYKPNPAAVPPAAGSTHVPGYAGEDDLGRIFTNRLPNGTWARDTQYLEVQVRATGLGGRAIPVAARIEWSVLDPAPKTELFQARNDLTRYHETRTAILRTNPGLEWWIRMLDEGGGFVPSFRPR